MKKIVYIFLFLISGFIAAQQDNSKFNLGNSMYNEGKFQEAITQFESIIENELHSSELYFNLANAYYKTNQVAPSIYYYEKALLLEPNDQEIKNNLAFAQNMTIDAIDSLPEIGFTKIIKTVVNVFSFDVWATLSTTLMLLFVVLFLSYYFSYATTKKRLLFISSFTSLFLCVMTLTLAFQKYNYVQNDKAAIVFAQEAEVKTDPNLRSETAFSLHEGTKVQIVEIYTDNWTKIKLSDGTTGWISTEDILAL